MLAFGWLLVPGAVQAAADIPSDLPSSVLYYEPPPPGAPPAPPVPNVPTVIGVGNVPGIGYQAQPTFGATNAAFAGLDDPPFPPGTDCRSTVFSALSYGVVYKDGLTVGNPSYVYADPLASNITVSNLDTADPSDHAGLGIIGWAVKNAPMNQQEQVSMGYWRGDIERNGRRYWNDILEPHQVMIYMEYSTLDGQGNEQYNWVPLLPVDQATRHQFLITQDDSGHFYNFYLDGELKWANVYMLRTPHLALMQNEDQNTDGVCDGGYTDVNWMEPAMDQLTVYDGHAVNEFHGPPWRTFNAALETMLPFLGYHQGCNTRYDNGYFWRCGDYNVPPDQ